MFKNNIKHKVVSSSYADGPKAEARARPRPRAH